MTTQLQALVRPFPSKFVKGNPSGGGSYVAHDVVEQRIMHALGRPPKTTLVEVTRGFVPGKAPNPKGSSQRAKDGTPDLPNAIVGIVLRMEATVDGEPWWAEECGDCEDPHNWPHDGARQKDAFSDAYKRCAMRLGVALHLWAQGEFYIDKALAADLESPAANPTLDAEAPA